MKTEPDDKRSVATDDAMKYSSLPSVCLHWFECWQIPISHYYYSFMHSDFVCVLYAGSQRLWAEGVWKGWVLIAPGLNPGQFRKWQERLKPGVSHAR